MKTRRIFLERRKIVERKGGEGGASSIFINRVAVFRPRFVAAVRKAHLWIVPFVSSRLGPDEAGPSQCGSGIS